MKFDWRSVADSVSGAFSQLRQRGSSGSNSSQPTGGTGGSVARVRRRDARIIVLLGFGALTSRNPVSSPRVDAAR